MASPKRDAALLCSSSRRRSSSSSLLNLMALARSSSSSWLLLFRSRRLLSSSASCLLASIASLYSMSSSSERGGRWRRGRGGSWLIPCIPSSRPETRDFQSFLSERSLRSRSSSRRRAVSSFAATRTRNHKSVPKSHPKIVRSQRLTVLANIPSVLIDILKLTEGLDDVDILPGPRHNHLRSLVETIVQNFQRFENMSPVLSLIIQPFVQHVHNLVEIAMAMEGRSRQ